MPTLYIYAPTDFIGGLPDEASRGGAAVGSPDFTLQLKAGAMPVEVEVIDGDGRLDELLSVSQGPQTFAHEAVIDGTTYPAGTEYHSAYDLLDTTVGSEMKVTTLHFDVSGGSAGPVHGLISSERLIPGQQYSFNAERTSHQQPTNTYDSYMCFTRGTEILTDTGAVPVEDLRVDDLVVTGDHGLQPIRWIGSRSLGKTDLAQNDKIRPIRIRRHALGTNIPSSDLIVSPQHRVLVRSSIAQKMFGTKEVLVAAKQLCLLDGIDVTHDLCEVDYFHILFDKHEVVVSNGAETESLYTGPEALKSVGPAALEEIFTLFPELKDRDYVPLAARTLATGRKGRQLAFRHKQNARALAS